MAPPPQTWLVDPTGIVKIKLIISLATVLGMFCNALPKETWQVQFYPGCEGEYMFQTHQLQKKEHF